MRYTVNLAEQEVRNKWIGIYFTSREENVSKKKEGYLFGKKRDVLVPQRYQAT